MDMIGKFAGWMALGLMDFIDWSLRHWMGAAIILVALIYWAGRQRGLERHHL